MSSKYFDGPIHRNRIDGVSVTGRSSRFEEGIVDCFFGGFDDRKEQRGHRIVG